MTPRLGDASTLVPGPWTVGPHSYASLLLPARGRRAQEVPFDDGTPTAVRNWRCAPPVPARRGTRRNEPCYEYFDDLVDGLENAMQPHLDAPFALFGHSMGALIAFEAARRFSEAGKPPLHLFVSGRGAPHLPEKQYWRDLSDGDLLNELRRLGGVPEEVWCNRELTHYFLPPLRGDLKLTQTYRHRPGPVLQCALTVLAGSRDPDLSLVDAEAWRSYTTGRFELTWLDCGHFLTGERERKAVCDIFGQIHERRAAYDARAL